MNTELKTKTPRFSFKRKPLRSLQSLPVSHTSLDTNNQPQIDHKTNSMGPRKISFQESLFSHFNLIVLYLLLIFSCLSFSFFPQNTALWLTHISAGIYASMLTMRLVSQKSDYALILPLPGLGIIILLLFQILSLLYHGGNLLPLVFSMFGPATTASILVFSLRLEHSGRPSTLPTQTKTALAALATLVPVSIFILSETASVSITRPDAFIPLALLSALAFGFQISTLARQRIYTLAKSLGKNVAVLAALGASSVGSLVASLTIIAPILSPIYVWQSFVSVAKDPVRFFLGAGSGEFFTSFTMHKPIEINGTHLWAERFFHGPNVIFEILLTNGLLGLSGLLLVVITVLFPLSRLSGVKLKNRLRVLLQTIFLFLATVFLIFLPFPSVSTIIALGIFFTGFSLSSVKFSIRYFKITNRIQKILIVLFLFISSGYTLYVLLLLAADVAQLRALQLFRQNNTTSSIKFINFAKTWYPQNPENWATASRIHHDLAIIASKKSQKEHIGRPEADWQLSLQYATVRTTLEPGDPRAWEDLAGVYAILSAPTQKQRTEQIEAIQQAIKLDPVNPVLHYILGDIYTVGQNHDEAQEEYANAARLKEDFAPAYYRLAQSFMLSGESEKAYAAYQQALKYTPQENTRFEEIRKEFELFFSNRQTQNDEKKSLPLEPE